MYDYGYVVCLGAGFTVVASELEEDFSETGLNDFTDLSADGFTPSERNYRIKN